jgi:hypothetical protein
LIKRTLFEVESKFLNFFPNHCGKIQAESLEVGHNETIITPNKATFGLIGPPILIVLSIYDEMVEDLECF